MPDRPLIPDLETRTAVFDGVEMREKDGELRFEGHASVFNSPSEDLGGFTEQVMRGAYRKVLANPSTDVRFMPNHNPDLVMARSTIRDGIGSLHLQEDTTGLAVDARLVPTTAARDLKQLVDARVITGMSYHFSMRNGGVDEWNDDYTERKIVSFGGLLDVGPVTYPAYQATDASMRSLVDALAESFRPDLPAEARAAAFRSILGTINPESSLAAEITGRALSQASAEVVGAAGLAEELRDEALATGHRAAVAALNTRLIDRQLRMRSH